MSKPRFPSSIALTLVAGSAISHGTFAQCQDKLLASSGTAQDQFGWATAHTARFGVVGALFEAGSGAAYVYEAAGGGWRDSGRLVAATQTGTDQFGSSVAVWGRTVLVGAPFSDSPPLDFTGSAHVFVQSGSDWNETQVLHASDLEASDQFGFSVSIDQDRMAIGAPSKSIPGVNGAGAVYLFEDQAGTWVEIDRLNASDAATGDSFGLSVSISGDALIVGAPFDDDGGTSTGSAYVFEFDGTSWLETQKLAATSASPSDEFGRALALDGDLTIIGARNDDDGGSNAGAAYVFERGATVWSFSQKLMAALPVSNDRFGSCVAAAEGALAVGSPFHDNFGPDRGRAHLFSSSGGGWVESITIDPSDGVSFDRFGSSVAIGGGRVLVGSVQNDELASNAGAAYGVPFAGPDCDNDGILDACETSPYLEFCFGDGGDGNGCTTCACNNEAPAGSCGGCLNSAGASARLLPSGAPVIMGSSFRVDMENANPGTFALLVSGRNTLPNFTTNPCFALNSGIQSMAFDGLRCVGGNVLRHGTRGTDMNGDVGITNNPWGATANFLTLPGFVAGETRYYQSFYREDPAMVCGRGLNTSQAFSVTFLP